MATAFAFLFSLILSFFLIFFSATGEIPSPCNKYECPSYDVIQQGKDYEIRRYNSPVLISNSPVQGDSFVGATRNGFVRLFRYIHGNNKNKQQIEMTAPVITEVLPSGGKSSFVVSFYVPKRNQANPPPADGLYVQRLKTVNAAVRQFGGFVTDSNIEKQVEALKASIAGTKWAAATHKGYFVAQYNSPFELFNRVNEIWFLFEN